MRASRCGPVSAGAAGVWVFAGGWDATTGVDSTAVAISTSVLSVAPVGMGNRDTMRAMLAATLAGLAAGLIHVLSGPDHLAAVAPLAGGRGRAWRAGFLWGLGHSGGVLAVGLLALALRGALPIDALSSWSERIVGVTLVGIGLWGFTRVLRGPIHSHVHVRAAAAVGVLHGVAGSSHFLGVLPALALPSAAASLGYLSGFAFGTVAAMSGFAYGLGLIGGSDDASRHRRWLLSASSAIAIVVGVVWMRG
jgi:hypothetical protein